MPECKYCNNLYKSSGVLTLHYKGCQMRKDYVKLEEFRLAQPITIVNNNTVINNNTVNLYRNEEVLFSSFKDKLLTSLDNYIIDDYNSAMNTLQLIKGSITDDDDKQIGEWISSPDIVREGVEGVDGKELLDHTAKCVNDIEDKVLTVIGSGLSMKEFLKLKRHVYNRGLFG